MKLYRKLLILALFCNTAVADHFADDQQLQCQVSVARTTVKFLPSDVALQGQAEEPARLDLKGVTAPSVFSVENATEALRKVANAGWKSAGSFTDKAFEHHLGNSAAAKLAKAVSRSAWEKDETYAAWGTRLAANTALTFDLIDKETAKNLNLASIMTMLTSTENAGYLARMGVRWICPAADVLLGDEIAYAAIELAKAAPGYTLWLFSEDELEGIPTAATAKVAPSVPDEDAVKPTFWNKVTKRTGQIWNKFAHSVEVGAKRAVQAVKAITWNDTKAFMSNKFWKTLGFNTEKADEKVDETVAEKAKAVELTPIAMPVTFDPLPSGAMAAAAA